MKIFDHTGKKRGSWTVIQKVSNEGTSLYLCKCVCGTERIVPSNKITRLTICRNCQTDQKSGTHIGKKNGKLTCIGLTDDSHRKLIVLCECGLQYTMKGINQFNSSLSCKSCARGYFPGLILKGITMVERSEGKLWKMKCHCGKLFEKIPRQHDGNYFDCGCNSKNNILDEAKKKIGNKYGYLTVKKVLPSENGHLQLLLKCKCGKLIKRSNGHEFKGYSCGCYLPESLPKGENHPKSTLKNCDIISMRELYESGVYTEIELAEIHGKPREYIRRIIRKQIWKHV